MRLRECTECGSELVFYPGQRNPPKRCLDCRQQAEARRQARLESKIECMVCGSIFRNPGLRGPAPKYCSDDCRKDGAIRRARACAERAAQDGRLDAWRVATEAKRMARMKAEALVRPKCAYCSELVRSRRHKTCGSTECKRLSRNERSRINMSRFNKRHKAEHGVSYSYKYLTPEKRAANLASLKAWQQTPEGKQRQREARQACSHRRRAQKAGVNAEKFTHIQVFERDGWICGLCGVPVDQDRFYPDLLSPSLDHIIPLSLQGPHTMSNTQLAHLGCNVRRGAKMVA